MTAKEYLSQIQKADLIIRNKKKEIENLSAEIYTIPAIDYGKERVQTSPSNKGFDKVDIKVDLEAEYRAEIEKYLKLRKRIIEEIEALDKIIYIKVLYEKYVDNKTLEQIAAESHYNYGYVRTIHGHALEAFRIKYLCA